MATAQQKGKNGQLPAGLKPNALARWGTIIRVLAPVFKAFGISTDGLDIMETSNGIHLRVSANSPDHNWKVIPAGESGVIVRNATVHGDDGAVQPVIGSDSLGDSPPPVLTVGSDGYVYLELTVVLTDTDGYVTSGAVTDAEVKFDTTIPDDDLVGSYFLPIAQISSGIISQIAHYNVQCKFCDDGSATGQGVLSVGVAAP